MPNKEELKKKVIEALKNVYDPEIPINIVDLGLIYEIKVDDEGNVEVKMTLTAPGCPIWMFMVQQAENAIKSVDGVKDAKVEIVWEPQWTPLRMTKEGRETYKAIFGYDIVEEYRRIYGKEKDK